MYDNYTRVIIADDLEESCDIIKKYLDDIEDIKVCDVVHNGEDAFNKICEYEPDVVILDIVMPKIDGMGVLRKINKHKFLKTTPKIIILTSANKELITHTAFELGASYYLIKPINKETLLETIDMVLCSQKLAIPINSKTSFIRKFLLEIGIPSDRLGYYYILYALASNSSNETYNKISGQIYQEIAGKHKTTSSCVENAIRKAIDSASKLGNEKFREIFENGNIKKEKPTNLKFLNMSNEILYLLKDEIK